MKGWTQDPAKELHLEVDDTLLRNADLRPLTENCRATASLLTAPHCHMQLWISTVGHQAEGKHAFVVTKLQAVTAQNRT